MIHKIIKFKEPKVQKFIDTISPIFISVPADELYTCGTELIIRPEASDFITFFQIYEVIHNTQAIHLFVRFLGAKHPIRVSTKVRTNSGCFKKIFTSQIRDLIVDGDQKEIFSSAELPNTPYDNLAVIFDILSNEPPKAAKNRGNVIIEQVISTLEEETDMMIAHNVVDRAFITEPQIEDKVTSFSKIAAEAAISNKPRASPEYYVELLINLYKKLSYSDLIFEDFHIMHKPKVVNNLIETPGIYYTFEVTPSKYNILHNLHNKAEVLPDNLIVDHASKIDMIDILRYLDMFLPSTMFVKFTNNCCDRFLYEDESWGEWVKMLKTNTYYDLANAPMDKNFKLPFPEHLILEQLNNKLKPLFGVYSDIRIRKQESRYVEIVASGINGKLNQTWDLFLLDLTTPEQYMFTDFY